MFKSRLLFFIITLLFPAASIAETSDDLSKRYREFESKAPTTKQHLSEEELNYLNDAVASHRVMSLKHLWKYDPTGETGLCFGTALGTQLLARKLGLAPSSIRKIFAVGQLYYLGTLEYRFHLATLLRTADGTWQIIDPIASVGAKARGIKKNGGPMTVSEWVRTARAVHSAEDRTVRFPRPEDKVAVQFYVTPAAVVIPDIRLFTAEREAPKKSVVDLKFEPGENGFGQIKLDGVTLYEPTEDALRKQFISTSTFDWLELKLPHVDRAYSYHGYFGDLLETLSRGH